MGIGIRGIRVEKMFFGRDANGKASITGEYALISTADKVLARQPFNSYGGVEISLSPDTMKAMDSFESYLRRDVQMCIGLDCEGARA